MKLNPIVSALDSNDVVISTMGMGVIKDFELGQLLAYFVRDLKAQGLPVVRLVVDLPLPDEE